MENFRHVPDPNSWNSTALINRLKVQRFKVSLLTLEAKSKFRFWTIIILKLSGWLNSLVFRSRCSPAGLLMGKIWSGLRRKANDEEWLAQTTDTFWSSWSHHSDLIRSCNKNVFPFSLSAHSGSIAKVCVKKRDGPMHFTLKTGQG